MKPSLGGAWPTELFHLLLNSMCVSRRIVLTDGELKLNSCQQTKAIDKDYDTVGVHWHDCCINNVHCPEHCEVGEHPRHNTEPNFIKCVRVT
jgi:hypothetical protein